jgi:two-component system LytT family sensor kinase
MNKSAHQFSRWQSALIIFGGWTLFGVFFSLQNYLNSIYFGRQVSYVISLLAWASCGYLWALLTPLILRLGRRYPIERDNLAQSLAIHLLFGSVLSLAQIAMYVFVRQWLIGDPAKPFTPLGMFQTLIVAEFHINLLLYLTVLGLQQAFEYYRRFREREQRAAQLELQAAQLETQLARAQLDALKMQLQPHFLFNTLNTISVLMQEDVVSANRMLVRLGDLLRITLKSANTNEISLRQELDFLRSYLEIEQTRFQDRLRIRIEAEPDALEARVPNLILQPLVENAIRHAVAPRAQETLVEIYAERVNGQLRMTVRDDGDGLKKNDCESNGIGLTNTRARLEKLYGAAQSFKLSKVQERGLEIAITIPFHTANETGS